jgi:Ca2+-binding EF-hand superfamily protein
VTALRKAIQTFDYDNDGKIPFEEFEYFMKNFGETENSYMDDFRIHALLECSKPLDSNGNIEVERLVSNLSAWYTTKSKKK